MDTNDKKLYDAIGEELSREKNNNSIIEKPEPKNSLEPNSMYFIIDNFKMFFSKNFSLYKVIYYFGAVWSFGYIHRVDYREFLFSIFF